MQKILKEEEAKKDTGVQLDTNDEDLNKLRQFMDENKLMSIHEQF